jgi:hypothetical protein
MRASKGSLARLACFRVAAATSSQGRRRPTVCVLQRLRLRCMSCATCLRGRAYCCVCDCDAFVFVSETVFATLSNCSGRVPHTCSRYVFLVCSFSDNYKGYVLCAYLWVSIDTSGRCEGYIAPCFSIGLMLMCLFNYAFPKADVKLFVSASFCFFGVLSCRVRVYPSQFFLKS